MIASSLISGSCVKLTFERETKTILVTKSTTTLLGSKP